MRLVRIQKITFKRNLWVGQKTGKLQIGEIPQQYPEKDQKRTKKGKTSPDREAPPFEPPITS